MSERSDILIIGSGIAGLSTALAAAPRRVTVISAGACAEDGASGWAQGGIAAAIGSDDTPERHAADTLSAGGHLNDRDTVTRLTVAAPAAVEWLGQIGARWDRHAGALALGREAAHSRARIVHAGGDATGAEAMRALRIAARAAAHIRIVEHARVFEMIVRDGAVVGIAAIGPDGVQCYSAPAVVLASGGLGALYRYSTNPPGVDGSGLALALSAGAQVSDMEFIQFHPTALAPAQGSSGQLPLLTEALRGAGALLIDGSGRRFMPGYCAAAELAPRDLVARAVWEQLERGQSVFLDARQAIGAAFPQRFPTVFAAAQARGLDPRRDPLPVVPAQHYAMGGVHVDARGHTSLRGLHAVGEVACNAVHGGNRLASNSLLEGLVFGRELGRYLADASLPIRDWTPLTSTRDPTPVAAELATAIADLLWRSAGLVRDLRALSQAAESLAQWRAAVAPHTAAADRIGLATQIVRAAIARRDSAGAHYRRDSARACAFA
jgi:L-aspartate oxidase